MNDRRAALTRLGRGLAGMVARSKEEAHPGWIRPPGAVAESGFRQHCDGCGECVEACPHACIGVLPESAGQNAGTPAMAPEVRACHLCEDLPCVKACDRGALVAFGDPFFFGVAYIEEDRCFAFQGPECGACGPPCPRDAIKVSLGKPDLDDSKCVGCGLCREACPVFGKAIKIV